MEKISSPSVRDGHGRWHSSCRFFQRLHGAGLPLSSTWCFIQHIFLGITDQNTDPVLQGKCVICIQVKQSSRYRKSTCDRTVFRGYENTHGILQAAELVTHTTNETKLHLKYCESFGIPLAEILNTEEHQGRNPRFPVQLFFFVHLSRIANTQRSMYGLHPLRSRYWAK
jgi:hypothetical protein